MQFLSQLNLNCALCDDMGLGKTIQALSVVASNHISLQNIDSLVICPAILVEHWAKECEKCIPSLILKPSIVRKGSLEKGDQNANYLMIASYDQVRKNLSAFIKIKFNYLVLDEAHLIKNAKSRTFKSIVELNALHKLILTGTPIQNNVLELWALFNFIMPGFLGTQKQFNDKYAKPILKSRDPECSINDQEIGMTALASLHKRCLPFIMRRMKSEVLKELPSKIIQDFICELSPIQLSLYQTVFQNSNLKSISISKNINKTHVFKKICNHVSLVQNEPDLVVPPQNVFGIEHNCKLQALKQLFEILGFGDESEFNEDKISHRLIIFSQTRKMLNLIQHDLLASNFPKMSYLYLDGSVKSESRFSIVDQFNNDNSIDLLLTTTAVGGLGLNLTGADTVIFIDHDWNPMKDVQAMDRAHRIGQKRIVNVYRIICKDTIEEQIMNYQEFKIHVASTVVSHENKLKDIKSNRILSFLQEDANLNTLNSDLEIDDYIDNDLEDSIDINSILKSIKK